MDPALEVEQYMLAKTKPIIEASARGDSDIQKFYEGSKIFITGGSGFIGKLIIEKLFRACAIDKIYVLIRSKKNLTPKERLDKILKDPVFDGLHKEKPNFTSKIIAVEGDVGEPNIGLSDDDWNTIAEEVDVIFHAAANVRFDLSLKEAVLTNVRGTREALRLGKACINLRAYVHVSTAYTHATNKRAGDTIYEEFHKSPAPPEAVVQLAEAFDKDKVEELAQCLKQDWPNTYTLSKALADEVIRTQCEDLPICIVKPTIVICTYCEPTPGWLDISCAFGPSGMLIGIGLGVMHTMLVDITKVCDLVPADIVTNAVIATAWETARKPRADEPKIYAVSNKRNPSSWRFQANVLRNVGPDYASPKLVWYPCTKETSNKFLFLLLTWLFHYIPAYIVDSVCLLLGQPRRFVKLCEKVYKSNKILGYFMLRDWFFNDDNTHKLYMEMSSTDRAIFNFDIETLNIKEMLVTWMIGVRKYIIKDNLQGTEYAKRKIFWLQILNYFAVMLYAFLWLQLFRILYWSISTTYDCLQMNLNNTN